MTLQFPNLSRSFDTTRGCVRFSGYDRTREVPFFIEEDAIRGVDGGALTGSEALLSAFDRNRETICKAAGKIYGQRREGSYTLKMADFQRMAIDDTAFSPVILGRLAKAMAFISGADHPTTIALKAAAESQSERDIKKARSLFLQLKPGDRKAALAMISD